MVVRRVSVDVVDLCLVVSFRQSEGDGHQTVDFLFTSVDMY